MPTIKVNEEKCKGCELCVTYCPEEIIALSDDINGRGFHPAQLVDEPKCTGCTICALVCPDICIDVFR